MFPKITLLTLLILNLWWH